MRARLDQLASLIAILIIAFMAVARFVDLDSVPFGFHSDEATVAANALCLAQTGADAHGAPWPLFPESSSGGYNSFFHVYSEALWLKVFGSSITAARSLVAVFTLLIIWGLYCLGCLLFDAETALWTTLAASVSPWAFQWSRVAVDSPTLCNLGMVWGLFFFFRKRSLWDAVWSAVFLTIGMFSYAAVRVQLPLVMATASLILWRRDRSAWKQILVTAGATTLFCFPLIVLTLDGTLLGRLEQTHVESWGEFWADFLGNLTPRYLFLTGDPMPRHSTQFVGQWSWLDQAALAGLFLWAIYQRIRRQPASLPWLGFFVASYLFGVLPAAITGKVVPHSVRSVGCWPFLSLMTGLALAKLTSWNRYLKPAFLALAIVFSVMFIQNFFEKYPALAYGWFDEEYKRVAIQSQAVNQWDTYLRVSRQRYNPTRMYYLMAYGNFTCEDSRHAVEQNSSEQ